MKIIAAILLLGAQAVRLHDVKDVDWSKEISLIQSKDPLTEAVAKSILDKVEGVVNVIAPDASKEPKLDIKTQAKAEEQAAKALEVYDQMNNALRDQAKASVYALDPAFHLKVEQIKQRYRDTKTYQDYNYHIDPKSWTVDKQVRQDVRDHVDAVHEAIDHFTRKDMETHSKIVANAAEASSRGVPYEVVAKEELEKDLKKLK